MIRTFLKKFRPQIILFVVAVSVTMAGCKKLVEVPPPITEISSANVYSSNTTAAAVLTGIYTSLSQDDQQLENLPAIFLLCGLSADELTLYDINNSLYSPYYKNNLGSYINTGIPNDIWTSTYQLMYRVNAAIEGVTDNSNLSTTVQNQLLGEAFFLRAFYYFYLVNLYGDVPLVTTTNYKVNASLTRSHATDVWKQVISDLKMAQSLLSTNFVGSDAETPTMERTRPTKWAATALLARSYLYTGDWPDAISQASSLIKNTSQFQLAPLNSVFLMNSEETIWSLQPVNSTPSANTGEGAVFDLPPSGPNTGGSFPVYLSNYVIQAFEQGDQRRQVWVDSVIANGTIYYFSYKYAMGAGSSTTVEYDVILRLGEQYLIRAEAEANMGDSIDATLDLDTIRYRAGLSNYSLNLNGTLSTAILHERQVELFTEWGHRWLDLKRLNQINSVMGAPGNVTGFKGGIWSSYLQFFPVELSELEADPELDQTAGYGT